MVVDPGPFQEFLPRDHSLEPGRGNKKVIFSVLLPRARLAGGARNGTDDIFIPFQQPLGDGGFPSARRRGQNDHQTRLLLDAAFIAFHRENLLDVLDLFPELFQQFLQPHHALSHFGIGRLGAHRVGLPVHFLDKKIQFPSYAALVF